ncbi:MAG: transcription termination/antitermination protein NusA [Gammaproteobacteria bacterium]|nr:transcription termination/antitermination protein NusA [Gammaproteobacteria bacterium]
MKDILLVVDSLANQKGVAKDVVFRAIEAAISATTAKRYKPDEVLIRVEINRDTGDYETYRQWVVVADDQLLNAAQEIILSEALKLDSELTIGDIVEEVIESIDFGRIDAVHAKQVILRELRKAERDEVAERFREEINHLIVGVVKKVSRDAILLDMGDGVEAVIAKGDLIPRESVRLGDRLRAVLTKINDDSKGPQLVGSRTCGAMLMELFALEVPEIKEDVIDIKAVARDPGSRAKIAVKTNDGRIDPIGACVGIRGSRVQAVSAELNGEKIDIILWDDDPAQLIVNAMAPAEIASITVDEESHAMDIAVREDQLAQAIGRNGQNVQLASQLTGWTLNVMSEDAAVEKNKEKSVDLVATFTNALDVDEDLAEILVQEGFADLEEIAYTPTEEMLNIEGFDEGLIEELRSRARDYLLSRALEGDSLGEVEPAKDLLELPEMTRHLAYVLASRGIVTREDLAEQAVDDITDIEDLNEELAAKLIMAARSHWFEE